MVHIKLYNYKPNIGDYVNFIFTEHRDDYLSCYLTEYDLNAIMTFQCLTSKKKIKSLKSLAPINKEMIGMIENIDGNNIELNIININKKSEDYEIFMDNKLNNHTLKKLINQYSHKYNVNLNSILNNYIYNLDIDDNILDTIMKSETNNDFYDFVRNNVKLQEVKSNELKLNIKCYGDINDIIKLFDETIDDSMNNSMNNSNINDINITQSKISEYVVTSNNKLDNFHTLLKNNIQKYNDLILN